MRRLSACRARSQLVAEPFAVIPISRCQTAHAYWFPRRVRARAFALASALTPNEGWAERRETFGCSGTRGASHNAGRSPLGAPPWRFWASGPRFRLLRHPPPYNGGHLPSGSVQRAPRSQVVVPGGRLPGPPEASGYEPPAAGRHSPLRLQDRLRRRPSMSEDADRLAWLRYVVKI